MKALIKGSAGFIGLHLLDALARALLAPLIRFLSLSLPLAYFPRYVWYLMSSMIWLGLL